jgi:hypothetical protein
MQTALNAHTAQMGPKSSDTAYIPRATLLAAMAAGQMPVSVNLPFTSYVAVSPVRVAFPFRSCHVATVGEGWIGASLTRPMALTFSLTGIPKFRFTNGQRPSGTRWRRGFVRRRILWRRALYFYRRRLFKSNQI